MTETIVNALFLLAIWAPPLAVLAGALLLLVPSPRPKIDRSSPVRRRSFADAA
jgi:hypothetical protein